MAIRVKPMSYGPVWVQPTLENGLLFKTDDNEFESAPPMDSPAMTLLYSVGSCMVLSLQMVAKRKKIILEPFTIRVVAHKGNELPAHFARYEISLSRNIHADIEVARRLLKDAKAICTISNSLNGTFELVIEEE